MYEHNLKALCYKYFSPDRWMPSIVPSTQTEIQEASTKFGEYGVIIREVSLNRIHFTGIDGVTVFEWRLKTTGANVLQALLAYFNVATKGSGKLLIRRLAFKC